MTIERAFKVMLMKDPFYGLFLTTLNKVVTDTVPTLAVGLVGINQCLFINQKFWESLTDTEQLAVLKHELLHICFFHLTMSSSFSDKQVMNLAADAEINQYIDGLPKGAIDYKEINAEFGLSLEAKAGTKTYYDALLKAKKQNPNKFSNMFGNGDGEEGDGSGECDGDGDGNSKPGSGTGQGKKGKGYDPNAHKKWKAIDKMSEAEKKLVTNQVEHSMKNVAQQVAKNQGRVPGELSRLIDELFKVKEQVFNWKSYFRRIVGNSVFVYTKKTLRKPSKRFTDSAGLKIKQKVNVLVGIDTSGSLSESELRDFFSEINHIYKSGAKVTILECDAQIGRIYEYNGKFDGKVTGGGGTDFAPVINHYNQNRDKYTTLIFFTDGYASLTNFKVMKKMIWLISSSGAQDVKYPGGPSINIPKS